MIVVALLTFAIMCLVWCISYELTGMIPTLLWLRHMAWLEDIQAMHETLDQLIVLDNQRHLRLELV